MENQKLKTPTYLNTIVEGTQNFVRFKFNLGKDWDELRVFAQFAQNGVAYNKYLDDTNSVYLPSEIVTGNCTLLLYGSDENVIATTNFITLKIDENMLVEGTESTDITPSLYQQLVTLVNAMDEKCDDTLAAIQALVDSKVDSVEGMGLSTNDFSDEYKAKLEGVSSGAEVNVQSDWNEANTASDSYISNKPTKVSDFENDADYATTTELQEATAPLATKNELNQLQSTMEGELQELRDDVGNNVDVRLGEIEQEMGNLATKTALENAQNTISQQLSELQEEVGANVDSRLTEIETEMGSFATKVEVEALSGELDNAKHELQQYADTHGVDGLLYENNLLYLTANGEIASESVEITGGGGGGGASNNATLTLVNTTGWLFKDIGENADCILSGTWSSIEDGLSTGNGIMTISVGNVIKYTSNIEQGAFSRNVTPYLKPGENAVKIGITDKYGNKRVISFSVNVVSLSITSNFDATIAYSGSITYTYTPNGGATKTMYFILDGEELETQIVSTTGRQRSFIIPAQSHGSHLFEVYFTTQINGGEVESNHLKYDLICIENGNTTPIISTVFSRANISQYETINIPYVVYNPVSLNADITLIANGLTTAQLTVDRNEQVWSYRADDSGLLTLVIACGGITKTITTTVSEIQMSSAETHDLELYLTSYGRSNSEELSSRSNWSYNNISCNLSNYNWSSDGWVNDEDGITVHRVSGDARCVIPLQIFANDFRTTGKTIEIEFATRDILNYDAVIMSCFSGDRGFKLTAQKAILKSQLSETYTQYKEDEHIRLSFVVEKSSENRFVLIYLNGIICSVIQYPEEDDFSQSNPVDITIGSNDCTIDLYGIRVYNNNLTRYQVLDNFIADTQNIDEKIDRFKRNQVYDNYGSIVIEKLPENLPYMILEAPVLPQYKGNKLNVNGQYIDPLNEGNNFEFVDAQADVQGTSSAEYARKNYKIKFKNGFIQNGDIEDGFAMKVDSIPTNTFTFKADYASSEGCNNVELVKLYNAICPYKTPPQEENPSIRQGIDGFPIVIFHNDGSGATFVGKYNFNNDKGTEEVYGFTGGDESWEIRNNTSDRVKFKSDDFEGSAWVDDFEARYPEDNTDHHNLSTFISWVKSTDPETATNNALEESVNYEGITYTNDTSEYRLAKFKNELSDYAEIDSTIFYYLFTELFLMVDSRAKNAFPSKLGGDKICWLPYDMDTALGINNEGKLEFGYELEDTDSIGENKYVYNAHDSVLWNNLRKTYHDRIAEMYASLRSSGLLTYDVVENAFDEHQAVWCEAIWNEDAYYKYLEPLLQNNENYLSMLQGSKSEQRKWWLYNRFRYIDSKYNAGDSLNDVIQLRGYQKSNITVEPYADIYASIKYGSYLVQQRALRGSQYTLECPVDSLNDTEIYIYSASQIKDIGDLSGLKVGFADFSKATKLTSLKIGDESPSYTNGNLDELTIGNNKLLRTLDVRNCPKLGLGEKQQSVDISGCTNIENIYFDGTSVTAVKLPDGGIIKKLHLPDTVKSLIIQNQPFINEFVLNDSSRLETLRLENVSSVIDGKAIFNGMPTGSRVRLLDIDWDYTGVADTMQDVFDLYDKFDAMRGLDQKGNNVEKAQITGTIRVKTITSEQLASLRERYSDINIVYQHITSVVTFYNDEQLITSELIYDGGNAVYSGDTPLRNSIRSTDYTFDGWSLSLNGQKDDEALNSIMTNRTVYAHYSESPRQYQIVFRNSNSEIASAEFDYGTDLSWSELSGNVFVKKDNEPVITIATPTKSATNEKVFDFNGWCRTIADESVNNIQDDSVIQNLGEEAGDLSDNVMVPRIAHAHFNWDWRPYNIPFYNVELAPNKIDNTPTANPIATLVTKYGFSPNVAGILPTRASDGCTYTFNGWTTDYTKFISTDTDDYFGIGEELPVIQGSVSEIGNVKYYAHYSIEPNQYAVTFNKNNGSSGSNSVTATYSSAMPSITPPTRTGYTFLGYFDGGNTKYYNANGTSAKNWDKWEVPQGGFSLIAHWQANSYEVKYNGNNSTSGSMANTTHTYDVAKALSENQFNRAYTVTFDYKGATSGNTIANLTSHYGFLGWATTSSGAKAYDNKQSVSNLASEQGAVVNLYAVWQPVSVTLPSPVRTGYTFGGWCTDNACTNIVGNGGAGYTPSNNITLYAKWTANNYTITFNGNKGSGSSTPSNVSGTKQATYDSAMPTATMPTRAGYDFQGYYDAATGGTKYYNANGTSAKNWNKTSNTTLYARWSAKSYTVYFKSENGSETYYTTSCAFDSTPVYSGTTPTKPDSDPTLDFEFVGWSTSMNSTGSYSVIPPAITTEGNKTYYARYVSTPQKYTISFNNNGTVINIQCGYGEIPSESQTYSQSVIPHLGTDFAGWVPRVSPVSGNTSYTAVYRETTGLNGMTWDRISEISQAGIAPEIFTIGDCKEVVLNGTMGIISFSNTKLYAYIIGFNHNPEIEETILGQDSAGNSIYTTSITFGTFRTDLTGGKSVALYDGYNSHNNINGEKYFNLSHWCTQRTNIFGNVVYDAHLYGGWAACDMRYDILGSTNVPPTGYGRDRVKGDTGNDPTSDYIDTNGNLKSGSLTTTLLACLPSELRKVMKPMKKYTNNVASDVDNNLSWITSTFDYLPLLAEYEIFGEVEIGNIYEDRFQSRYEYYLRGNSRNKYRHNNIGYELDWWTRTPASGLSGVKVDTDSSGGSSTSIGGGAKNSCGVAPIFKV